MRKFSRGQKPKSRFAFRQKPPIGCRRSVRGETEPAGTRIDKAKQMADFERLAREQGKTVSQVIVESWND